MNHLAHFIIMGRKGLAYLDSTNKEKLDSDHNKLGLSRL